MDLYKTIRQLYEERERLDRVIASLEELQSTGIDLNAPLPVKRRGRKSMNPDERREVSERMKRYWANRRKPKK
ncbi:MAG: hypothetical protein ACE15B_23515 [Bryobacteraceae bacterium]